MKRTNQLLAMLLSAALALPVMPVSVCAEDLAGDRNGDGLVNPVDAALMLQNGEEGADALLHAICKNGLDASYQDEKLGNVNSVFRLKKDQGCIQLQNEMFLYDALLEEMNHKVPVIVNVYSGEPIQYMEFGFSCELPYTLVEGKDIANYKNEPWFKYAEPYLYDIIEDDYVYENSGNRAWYAYASAEGKTLDGTLAMLIVDVPEDTEYTSFEIPFLSKTDSRTAFLGQFEDGKEVLADPMGSGAIFHIDPPPYGTLDITSLPDKLTYRIGEELDLTGGTVKGAGMYRKEYWDVFYPTPMTDFTVDDSEFDNTKPGTYKIYVTCANATAEFEVRVVGDADPVEPPSQTVTEYPTETMTEEIPTTIGASDPSSLSMHFEIKPPAKLVYKMGETLDLTGGTGMAYGHEDGVYWDTFEQPLDSTYFTVDASEFDSSTPGYYTIYVTCKGCYLTSTREFTVTVLDKDGNPLPTEPVPTESTYPVPDPTEPVDAYPIPETTEGVPGPGDRFGDVDLNGKIDIMDCIHLNKYLIGEIRLIGLEITFADANRDGKIDFADSLTALKKALGMTEKTEPETKPETETVTEIRAETEPVSTTHFYGASLEKTTASDGMKQSVTVYTSADTCPLAKYDEAFFAEKNLIWIEQTESSGSHELNVDGITVGDDGVYNVTIIRTRPEICTADLCRWYIAVETDKGVTDAEHVKVFFAEKMYPASIPD